MRTTRRSLFLVFIVTVMIAAMAIPALAGPEGTLVSKINSSRAANGLAPLETYWDLTDDARAQSARMMDRGEIFHNPSLSSVTGVWQSLGENVGMGVDISALHTAFMNSAAHRGNILGNYNYVGVGVKTDGAGVNWVTVIFMRAAPGLNGGTTTTTTTAPPATTTTTTMPPAQEPPVPPATTTTTTPATGAKASVAAQDPTPADDGSVLYGLGGKRIYWD